MNDIGFVILHYKTFSDTKNCVESILHNVPQSPIIIVDNGSNNGTGEKLRMEYYDEKYVEVLFTGKNIGFANGNNMGIDYLRKSYQPQFVVVMNNDTLILQNNFLEIIENEYKISKFAVLGPQIIINDGSNKSNPVEQIADTTKIVKILLFKKQVKLLLNRLHLNRFLHDAGTSTAHKEKYNNLKRYENVKLHGACWIFSKKFFEVYSGINNSTFLYFEEDILYLETVKKGLLTVYNPDIRIKHFEDSSTNCIVKNNREKNIFVLTHEIQSLKILMNFLRLFDENH